MDSEKPRRYRFADGDREILGWFIKLGYLTADDLHYLVGRHKRQVWHRLQVLRFLGYLRYERRHPKNEFVKVYFLTQKGCDKAHELGLAPKEIRAVEDKRFSNIPHDLLISELLISLIRLEREGTIRDLHYSRQFRELYHRWGEGQEDRVNPDCYFWFEREGKYPFFFVEIERNDKERFDKLERYAAYPLKDFETKHGADNFFVLTLLPSTEKALNLAKQLANAKNYRLQTRKFWTGEFSQIQRLTAKEFFTPKDEGVSLLDCVDAC